jgi:hypothetical protein
MTIVQALAIINDCARIKKLAGGLAMYPYSVEQVVEAALEISHELRAQTSALQEQLKTVNAQLRMSNARAAKDAKAGG